MKTSELTGTALDWAVAMCEGLDYFEPETGPMQPDYSTDWAQGGPIIEREGIEMSIGSPDKWVASMGGEREIESGPTPLIAAMRCYVQACFGDEVDIPEEVL